MKAPVNKTTNTRSPLTVNKVANKPRPPSGFKTAAGVQQYVSGATYKERSDKLRRMANSLDLNDPQWLKKSNALAAAHAAETSRSIAKKIGPKAAKTDAALKIINEIEQREVDRARADRLKAIASKKKK